MLKLAFKEAKQVKLGPGQNLVSWWRECSCLWQHRIGLGGAVIALQAYVPLCCWQEWFYCCVYSMLSEELHGPLGPCLCEGVYAWGAKSETCWVSSVFHRTSEPEALAEPEGAKKYVWHFPSSHPLPLPSQILLVLHSQVCVYKCSHTLVEESLAWGVHKPSTFSVYSSMAAFCVCLITWFWQSWDIKSSNFCSKCPSCVFASITPELWHKCIYRLPYSALSSNCFHK